VRIRDLERTLRLRLKVKVVDGKRKKVGKISSMGKEEEQELVHPSCLELQLIGQKGLIGIVMEKVMIIVDMMIMIGMEKGILMVQIGIEVLPIITLLLEIMIMKERNTIIDMDMVVVVVEMVVRLEETMDIIKRIIMVKLHREVMMKEIANEVLVEGTVLIEENLGMEIGYLVPAQHLDHRFQKGEDKEIVLLELKFYLKNQF